MLAEKGGKGGLATSNTYRHKRKCRGAKRILTTFDRVVLTLKMSLNVAKKSPTFMRVI